MGKKRSAETDIDNAPIHVDENETVPKKKKKKDKKEKHINIESRNSFISPSNDDLENCITENKNEKKKLKGKMSSEKNGKNNKKRPSSTTHNKLSEKLMVVQAKRLTGSSKDENLTDENSDADNADGKLVNESKLSHGAEKNWENQVDKESKEVASNPAKPSKSAKSEKAMVNYMENDASEVQEEEDPEKAAVRAKKREKRKQKKLARIKHKEELAKRAGSAKVSAVDYLDQWKNKRDEWKFSKVRQCWLLQNIYDQTLIDNTQFEVLLEYLEGLKGQARATTLTEAEKHLVDDDEEDEDEDNDEKLGESEEKTDQSGIMKLATDPVKQERARQIIQILT